jgi:hypothetical protein
VSALALHSSLHAIDNAPKITTEGATTADMAGEPETSHSLEQNCPLFRLSTELRLEICRFAIQHALDLISPPPNTNHKYSAVQTTRGALALLYTCRALRTESIDAMEPLANAARSSVQSEIDLAYSRRCAAVKSVRGSKAQFAAYSSFDNVLKGLLWKMVDTDEVCSVLAFAREADKMRARGETSRRTIINSGQWML